MRKLLLGLPVLVFAIFAGLAFVGMQRDDCLLYTSDAADE